MKRWENIARKQIEGSDCGSTFTRDRRNTGRAIREKKREEERGNRNGGPLFYILGRASNNGGCH